jgi:trimeric autotransporter adhesin
MKTPVQLINATTPVRNLLAQSPLQHGFVLLALGLSFALLPTARAVDPPPDGGYPNMNTAEGQDALFGLTTGFGNTAHGFQALFSATTGSNNVAAGANALFSNTTGSYNTSNGSGALEKSTIGTANTANGFQALYNNISGSNNTADGVVALYSNTSGFANIANGNGALFGNTTGINNVAIGLDALYSNTTGRSNTANGYTTLFSNATGINNTASGASALQSNTSGSNNTAIGNAALGNNRSGSHNIALGNQAGRHLTTGDGNIDIGNGGVAGEAGTIRVGEPGNQTTTFIAGISGTTVAGGVGVVIDSNGHLGTIVSSERFKDGIKPMDKTSEAIFSLQPVTFHYKKDLDPVGIPQFGLVAEQVAKVDPDLVARDTDGKPFTVRYEAVNAMLLNEFLTEHRKVEALEATVAAQQKDFEFQQQQSQATAAHQQQEIQALTAALKAQSAQIQKVSD